MRNYNPHRITANERRAFVLSGDKKMNRVDVKRRKRNAAGQKYQPLIAFRQGKSTVSDVRSTWPQYYERDKREFVVGVE